MARGPCTSWWHGDHASRRLPDRPPRHPPWQRGWRPGAVRSRRGSGTRPGSGDEAERAAQRRVAGLGLRDADRVGAGLEGRERGLVHARRDLREADGGGLERRADEGDIRRIEVPG